MLEIRNEKVFTFNRGYLDIFWEIAPVSARENIEEWEFFVLRSPEDPKGEYSIIGGPFVDVYTFRDYAIDLFHRAEHIFYKIKGVRTTDNREVETDPFSLGVAPNLYALYMSDMWEILMQSYVGTKVWIFKRRKFGSRCQECWDVIKHRRTKSNCLSCFDTGFVGGYHRPIEAFMKIEPESHSYQLTSLTKQDIRNTQARISMYPPVEPDDVVVEIHDNARWAVVALQKTEMQRARVSQMLTIHEIPEKDVEYELKVPDSESFVRNLSLVDDRQYVNPHS